MKQEYLDILGIESEEELYKVDWYDVSFSKKLSEDFIREFKDDVCWYYISYKQKLSEDFIREFKNYVDWDNISSHQKLSEDFIREFKDDVCWCYISTKQKLSKDFVDEFKDSICWKCFSSHVKLSKDFALEFKDFLFWNLIANRHNLSEDFIDEYKNELSEYSWRYVAKATKIQMIKNSGLYKIDGDYILAYKSTLSDGYSVYDPDKYQYKVGNIYVSDCDCDINNGNSFGLSAWTKEGALNYYNEGELYKVKIHIDDVGAFIEEDSGKLRCFRLEIIEKFDF